jgi:hypothetical protein
MLGMTAKEKVLEHLPRWSEEHPEGHRQAERALAAAENEHEDPVIAAFRDAPEDDEPWTEEDEAAAAEGRADIAAGRTVTLAEIKRESQDEHERHSSASSVARVRSTPLSLRP